MTDVCEDCKYENEGSDMYPCCDCENLEREDFFEAKPKPLMVKYCCRSCIHGPCTKEFREDVNIPNKCLYSSCIATWHKVILNVEL